MLIDGSRTSVRPAQLPRARAGAALAVAAAAWMTSGPFASQALAVAYVWNNPAGGTWNTSSNWLPNTGAPVAADTATFNSGGATPITVNLAASEAVASIIFDTANAAAYTIGTSASPALTLSDTTRTIIVNPTVTRNQLFNSQVVLGTAIASTYTVTNNGSGSLTFAGGFVGGTGGTAGAKTLSVGGTGNNTISGAITTGGASSLALTKSFNGSGTLTLTGANTYTGNTLVDAGTLHLDFASSAVTANIINNGLASGGSALTLGRTSQNIATAGTLQITGGASGTFSQRFNGTTFTVLSNNIRVTESAGTTVNLQLGGLTRGVNLPIVDFTLPTSGTITTTSTTAVTGGVLTAGTGAYATVDGTYWATNSAGTLGQLTAYDTAAAAGSTSNVSLSADETLSAATINTLRFDSATNRTLDLTGTHTVTAGGVLVTAGSTNGATIGTTVDDGILKPGAANTLNLINRSAGTLTTNSVLANGTGATSVLFVGDNLVKGTNTYTGTSRIYPGKTRIFNASNLGGAGAVNVYSGGTLELDGTAGDIALATAKTFIINGTGAPGAGGAIRNVAGNNSIGAINIGNAGGTHIVYSAAGKLTLGAGGGQIDANNAAYTFDGPGDIQLDGNTSLNTSSGALLFKNGTGTLYINNTSNSLNTLNINAGIYDSTVSALPVNGANISAILLNGGVLQIRDGGTFTRNLSSFAGANVLRMNLGSTGFAARGSADAAVNLSSGAVLSWNSTGGFLLNTQELVLGSSIADRAIDFTNPINFNNAVRTVRVLDNVSSTGDYAELSGILSSTTAASGGLTKEGPGTLLLTAVNTYAGATTINGGTLLVGDGVSGSLANTPVTVNNTATLGGSGVIGGAVTVNSGGHLAPGNSPGTLTINNTLTLNAGSVSDFELASTSIFDKIIGLTGVTYGGTLNVTGTVDPTAATYTLFTLASGSSLGGFAVVNLPTAPASFEWRDFDLGVGVNYFDAATGSIELVTVVPEPTLLGIAALAGTALLGRRRRVN